VLDTNATKVEEEEGEDRRSGKKMNGGLDRRRNTIK